MNTNTIEVVMSLVVLLYSAISYSQITIINANANANALKTKLSANGGFTITNQIITKGNNKNQSGVFSNGSGGGLSLNTGIILTTGKVSKTTQVSKTQSDVSAQGATTYSDADLIALDSQAINDVVVYEYDFIINGTEPKIFGLDYQFASEEYPDYVCSDKNDVFGFFISGGDLPGTANLASVGGENSAVNYVNSGIAGIAGIAGVAGIPCELTQSASFVQNYVLDGSGGLDTTVNGSHTNIYNGFTTTLRAYTILRPGITYHMKMAIADVGDDIYDSAVFVAPIRIEPIPPKSDIDFDGADDYVNTKPFMGDFQGATMMSWLKLDNGYSSRGEVCGQDNFKIYVGGDRKVRAYVKTGSSTISHTLRLEDSTPADGWYGYVQARINGGAWMNFTIDGFMTDWLIPAFGSASIELTIEAAIGDTIDIKYVRNGSTAVDRNKEKFSLTREDGTVLLSKGFNVNHTNTTYPFTVACPSCSPVVSKTVVGPVLDKNMWYNTTAKFDGATGSLSLYVNGDEVGTTATGLGGKLNVKDDISDFSIGRDEKNTNRYFKGAIDDVRVYNKSLSLNQMREQIYQEVENVGGKVYGSTIPKAIDNGSLNWSDLKLYFNLDLIFDVTVIDNSAYLKNGFLNNIFSVQVQSAPLPYVANASGNWTTAGTWQNGTVWDITSLPNKDWAIVQVTNNSKLTTTASHTHLGLLVDSGSELEIQNDQLLTNTSYLKLDGQIDLVDESQLIQTENSELDVTSGGYLERDQQGKSSIFSYNFWSSPVNPQNITANNTDYSIAGILKDGTTAAIPQTITFNTGGYDGASGVPITLADYWIFKYVNQPDLYANWMSGHIRSTGTLKVGEGYTQKGTGSVSATQNYVFSGKPNNGVIQHTVGANNVYLVGNPYASALDADQFINDNLVSVENTGDVIGTGSSTGALYFWEHFSTNNSHYLAQYEGGYATYNLAGGVIAIPDPDVSSNGSGTIRPGRYVPVAQGFFVQGSPAGGTIEFNNAQRAYKREAIVADDSVFTKTASTETTSSTSSNTTDLQRVYFKFTTPEGPQRELLLAVKDGLADGMNYGYDARMLDDQVTDCAWIVKTDIDEKLVIQGIGAVYEDLELPLQIKVGTEGVCKFEVESLADLDSSLEVYFLDKVLNISTRLEEGTPVEFNLDSGEYNDRFYVVFKVIEVLAIDDLNSVSEDLVVFYDTTSGSISISDSSVFTAKNVSLYNVLGQQVVKVKTDYTNVTEIVIPVQVATGAYLVTFDYNNGKQVTKKLIIK